ncbi:MAG: aminopeptidase P family protein [Solirubrobacterales bacterium]|nr:aminopeptidase P family protein [Solirubrobacterales bacterium]
MSASEIPSAGNRAERLAAELGGLGVEALLVDSLIDIRYLTSFSGSNALVLLIGEGLGGALGQHRFMTDFRYTTQSAEQVPEAFERQIHNGETFEALVPLLETTEGRLGFDEGKITVRAHRRLAELLPAGWKLVPCNGAVERLRAIKDAGEVLQMRAAAELADEALKGLLDEGLVGRTERDVAIDLVLRMRRLGAEAPSFEPIVAAGAHAALPHAEPLDQTIPRDVLVTIDWGAQLEGYCSDCTRTYATGEGISQRAREIHALVLDAQERALGALAVGRNGREMDAVARGLIEEAGHGEHFGHGLGHGVGLEVHEAPRLSRTASEEPLKPGNVVTVEPGVYLPGELGVRIEDLVVLTGEGKDVLTGLAKTLAVIS